MTRTDARANAMKLIYAWELGGDNDKDARDELLEIQPEESEKEYMEILAEGVKTHQQEVDGIIVRYAKGWTVDRLAKVDLSILRVAVYEMLYCKNVPASVVMNEAVELAHHYSDDKAPAFVNGILGSFLRQELA